MKTQFGLKEYFKPTPKLFRKIGDACMTVGATFTTWAGITDQGHWLIIAGGAFTLLGKLVTNFFSEK